MDEMSDRVQGSLASTARVLSLSMQDDAGATPPEGAERAISRLQAMAQVYGLLQREGVDAIDLKETCRQIAQAACRKHALPEHHVSWEVAGPRVILPFRAAATVACAINELAANAVRHGCAARPTGRVRIDLTEETRQIIIQVEDDGDGLPADFDLSRDSGLGLQIARDVVEYDLGGEFELVTVPAGVTIRLRLPKRAH
jgi:two-component system, sensor histidine kinase PdtaS